MVMVIAEWLWQNYKQKVHHHQQKTIWQSSLWIWPLVFVAIYLKPIQLAPNKESANKLTAKILGLPLKYGEPQGPPEGWNSSRLHHLWNKSWSSISEENRFWICWRKSSNKFTFHWAPYHHSSLLVSCCSSSVFCQSELSLLATSIKKYWINMRPYMQWTPNPQKGSVVVLCLPSLHTMTLSLKLDC